MTDEGQNAALIIKVHEFMKVFENSSKRMDTINQNDLPNLRNNWMGLHLQYAEEVFET
jgi:hypothetical protein